MPGQNRVAAVSVCNAAAGAFKSYMRVERFTKLAVAGHVEWPGRALLDDYAGAVGATRAQYRLLAGAESPACTSFAKHSLAMGRTTSYFSRHEFEIRDP